jgi:hypothetical protein
MSRRHHGRPHHARRPVPGTPAAPDGVALTERANAPAERGADGVERLFAAEPVATNGSHPLPGDEDLPSPTNGHRPTAAPTNGHGRPSVALGTAGEAVAAVRAVAVEPSAGATAPQLRRFIKSRPYVPMHELRRRFGIEGGDDDVTPVELAGSHVYVGLPEREGRLLGDLLRGGEIGYELSLDPRTPIVIGLYPMRPVPRS